MSRQSDVEAALSALIETNIVGAGNVHLGSLSQPRAEGNERYAAVRQKSTDANRLRFGQVERTETYAITVWWRSTIDRDTAATEWQAFVDALIADQHLGGLGVEDSWPGDWAWGDASDAGWLLVQGTAVVRRIE